MAGVVFPRDHYAFLVPAKMRLDIGRACAWLGKRPRGEQLLRAVAADASAKGDHAMAARALLGIVEHVHLGIHRVRAVDDAAAQRDLEALLRQHAAAAFQARHARYLLASVLLRRGQHQRAIALLRAWAKSAREHLRASNLLRWRKAGSACLWHAQRAIDLAPNKSYYRVVLSRCQLANKDIAAARASLAEALRLAATKAAKDSIEQALRSLK